MSYTITDKSIDAKDLIGKYNNLNGSLTDYQNAYNNYVKCINDGGLDTDCRDSSKLSDKTTTLTNDIQAILAKITTMQSDPRVSGLKDLPSTDELKAKHANLQTLRNKMDVQLAELYNVEGSIPNMYKNQMDSTVYASILWTVLATSMVYYIFTKM